MLSVRGSTSIMRSAQMHCTLAAVYILAESRCTQYCVAALLPAVLAADTIIELG
jgi:hypothetical protein